MAESPGLTTGEWQRLSPWSIFHFAWKAIVQNLQTLIFAGAPAYLGASRFGFAELPWIVPVVILILVLIGATITFIYFRYRILDDSIQVRRGALFKKHVNLSFRRVQNVSIEHPFYFRPFGRVTLKIDGAGSRQEEVSVAALDLKSAQQARDFIVRQKNRLEPAPAAVEHPEEGSLADSDETLIYSRSVSDLIVHGLTNNRSFFAVAAILGFLLQSGLSPAELAVRLGIDFDVVIAGLSLVRIVILAIVSLIAAIGMVALLSVLVSIFTYYGFSMYRSADGLTIRRGLLTKHEIHVKKSRIQTIQLRQDWLDRLLGRHNIILERITHTQGKHDPSVAQKGRILVPSVKVHETAIVTDEILPGCRIDQIDFTPINIRYFYKFTALFSLAYIVLLAGTLSLPDTLNWVIPVLLTAWPLHIFHTFLSWKRGGLAVDGDVVIARSGAIGIDYRLFAADKIQDVTHIQSILMRRHDLSSLKVHTASTTIRVPYMPTGFMRAVVDYCAFRAESSSRSWM